MAYQSYYPQLYGGIQPLSGQLTVATFIDSGSNSMATAFIANGSDTEYERVRLAIKPIDEPVDDKHYIVYDLELEPRGILQLSYFGLNSENQVLVYSQNGYAIFNVSGTTIVNHL